MLIYLSFTLDKYVTRKNIAAKQVIITRKRQILIGFMSIYVRFIGQFFWKEEKYIDTICPSGGLPQTWRLFTTCPTHVLVITLDYYI